MNTAWDLRGPSDVAMTFSEFAKYVATINELQQKVQFLEKALAAATTPQVAMSKPPVLPATKPTPKQRKAPKVKRANKAVRKATKSGPSSKSWWTNKRRAEHGAKIQAKKDALKALQAPKPAAKAVTK